MLKKEANKLLRGLGYELRRLQQPLKDYRNKKEICPRTLLFEGQDQFLYDVDVSRLKKSRLIKAWVSALSAYPKAGRSQVRIVLDNYFQRVQPRTVAEILALSPRLEWHLRHPMEYVMPWVKATPDKARASREKMMKEECREHGFPEYTKSDGWKGFGPVSDAVLDVETDRLIKVYDSISKNGFQDDHGYTQAQLFIAGKDFHVQPYGGWHRVAAMIALGYKAIPMKLGAASMHIRRDDFAYWPGVRAGLFSESEALTIFDQRFGPYYSACLESSHVR